MIKVAILQYVGGAPYTVLAVQKGDRGVGGAQALSQGGQRRGGGGGGLHRPCVAWGQRRGGRGDRNDYCVTTNRTAQILI